MDLRERLMRARLPDEPEGVGWQLGMNQAYLKQLIEYWRDEFDWRAQERRLNEIEQFKTRIDGLDSCKGRLDGERSRNATLKGRGTAPQEVSDDNQVHGGVVHGACGSVAGAGRTGGPVAGLDG